MRKLAYTIHGANGRATRRYDDGTEGPERWYHRAAQFVRDWWRSRDWRRRQREFERTGTRYYGGNGTIHRTGEVNVELHKGKVVAVWFRCQPLPFTQHEVEAERALSMRQSHQRVMRSQLCGVEILDPPEDRR